jgi:hypothetical protein
MEVRRKGFKAREGAEWREARFPPSMWRDGARSSFFKSFGTNYCIFATVDQVSQAATRANA